MTPRSFWTIVIKIMGLCVAYGFLTTVWRTIFINISFLSIVELAKFGDYASDMYIDECTSLLLIIFYIMVFYSFLFKTQWVINKLKLDKGYEEQNFELKISHCTVLKISVITIGGWLILMIFPDLIHEIFSYFWERPSTTKPLHYRNIIYIVTNLIKIIIGIFMIARADSIAKFIDRKNKIIEPLP